MDFDKVLEDTGPFGWFQVKVVALCYTFSACNAIYVFIGSFANFAPDYRCKVPDCDTGTSPQYAEDFLEFTTPYDPNLDSWEQCNYYKPDHTNSQSSGGETYYFDLANQGFASYSNQCTAEDFSSSDVSDCDSGYVFDTEVFSSSSVIEYSLTCDRTFLLTMLNTTYMVGMLFGSMLSGLVSDWYGRKASLAMCVLLTLVGGLLCGLSAGYWMLVVGRLVGGLGGNGLFGIAFILVVEYVVPEHRTPVGILINLVFSIGGLLLDLCAYFIRDSWRGLTLAACLPAVLMLPLVWVLPESIRWLTAKGRHEQTRRIVETIARTNGRPVPDLLLQGSLPEAKSKGPLLPNEEVTVSSAHDCSVNISSSSNSSLNNISNSNDGKKSVLDLLRTPNMRTRCLISFFIWSSVTLVYYGLTYNSTSLSGDTFLNFALTLLVEVPAYLFAWLALDRMGRKGTLLFVLLLGGVSCIAAALLPKDQTTMVLVFSLLGKGGGAAGFSIIFIYGSEIFPTEYRSTGIGACSMCARVGGILAPIVTSMGEAYYPPLPSLVFGVLAVVAAALTLLLPETTGCVLPTTLQESEQFGSDQPLLYFHCSCTVASRRLSTSSIIPNVSQNDDGRASGNDASVDPCRAELMLYDNNTTAQKIPLQMM